MSIIFMATLYHRLDFIVHGLHSMYINIYKHVFIEGLTDKNCVTMLKCRLAKYI